MDDYLAKPMRLEELEERIGRWLGEQSQRVTSQHDSLCDRARIMSLSNQMAAGFVEAVSLYEANGKQRLVDLGDAIAGRRSTTAVAETSALRSASAEIGVARMADLAAAMQVAVTHNEIEPAEQLLGEMQVALLETIELLRVFGALHHEQRH